LPTGYAHMVLLPDHAGGIVVLANGVGRVAAPRIGGIAAGVANVLVGKPAVPASEDRVFQIVTVFAFVVILVQVIGILRTTLRLRRWRMQPQSRPAGALSLTWHVGVPLAVSLAWGVVVLLGVPLFFGLALAETVFSLGDFAYLIAASAAVALIWGLLRTLLVWWALHAGGTVIDPAAPIVIPAPATTGA
jgi:hypothetical protein